MNRSAHRRPRAIAIARTDNESRQLAFRLSLIAAVLSQPLSPFIDRTALTPYTTSISALKSRRDDDAIWPYPC